MRDRDARHRSRNAALTIGEQVHQQREDKTMQERHPTRSGGAALNEPATATEATERAGETIKPACGTGVPARATVGVKSYGPRGQFSDG